MPYRKAEIIPIDSRFLMLIQLIENLCDETQLACLLCIGNALEDEAIGLTFNSKLAMKMYGSNLNTGLVANPIGHVHVAIC